MNQSESRPRNSSLIIESTGHNYSLGDIENMSAVELHRVISDLAGEISALKSENSKLPDSRGKLEHSRDCCKALYCNFHDSSLIGLAFLKQNGSILYANAGLAEITGLEGHALIGRTFSELICPWDRDLYQESFEQMLEEDTGLKLKLKIMKKDFTPLWVMVEGIRINNSDREPAQVRLALIDLQARLDPREKVGGTDLFEEKVKERTAELERLRFEAETANRSKSKFLANMNHELRTPLNSIIGFSQILDQEMVGPLNDLQKEYINDIISSGHHLLSLINDILDLSKMETDHLTIEQHTFAVKDLIDQCLAMFQERLKQENIGLKLLMDENPGTITADKRRIKQVLINLLSNAHKFGGRDAEIGLEVFRENGGLRISVWDTGTGIARDNMPRLFQPFSQLDSSPVRVHEGTGLGLFLSRRIVELHGGMIWAESTPGKGSRFTFEIPGQVRDRDPEDRPAAMSESTLQPVFDQNRGNRHFERFKAFTDRKGVGLALLRLELIPMTDELPAPEDAEAVLPDISRKYEFFLRTPENNIYDLILVGPEKVHIQAIIQRYSTRLKEKGYRCLARYAFSPEHGETLEDLQKAVAFSGYIFMDPESAPAIP